MRYCHPIQENVINKIDKWYLLYSNLFQAPSVQDQIWNQYIYIFVLYTTEVPLDYCHKWCFYSNTRLLDHDIINMQNKSIFKCDSKRRCTSIEMINDNMKHNTKVRKLKMSKTLQKLPVKNCLY